MTRRGMLAAAMAVAGAFTSTAVGESAAPVDAPHDLPGVSDMELKQVHVVFRHGARAPLSTKHGSGDAEWLCCGRVKRDLMPVKVLAVDGSPQPQSAADARQRAGALRGGCHLGQLSDLGCAQAVALGVQLRERYVPALLPPDSLPALPHVAVRSSNLQRTVATAAGVLTGLFPDAVGKGVPAEVRVAPDEVEWLFPNTDACPRLKRLWKAHSAAWESPVGEEAWKRAWAVQLAALDKALPEEHRAALKRAWGVVELLDHSTSRHAHGLPPLGAMTPAHVDDVRAIAAHVVSHMFTGAHQTAHGAVAASHGDMASASEGPGECLKLSVGRLLADIIASMESAASQRSPLRVALYAAHDTTVLPLLLAVQQVHRGAALAPPPTWPPYAAALAVELWAPSPETAHAEPHALSSNGASASSPADDASRTQPARQPQQHYVRVLYNGAVVPLPCADERQGGKGGACTLAAFAASLDGLKPTDFHAECHVAGTQKVAAQAV